MGCSASGFTGLRSSTWTRLPVKAPRPILSSVTHVACVSWALCLGSPISASLFSSVKRVLCTHSRVLCGPVKPASRSQPGTGPGVPGRLGAGRRGRGASQATTFYLLITEGLGCTRTSEDLTGHMVSVSAGLVIRFKKHFLFRLFNLMKEIISWEIGRADLFPFWGGGGGEKICSNCRLF